MACVAVMVAFRRSPGSEHCLGVMIVRKQFQDHFLITSSFTTVPLLLFSLLFAYVSHHIFLVLAATPPHYLVLPLRLNSLDIARFEIAESS